MEIINIYPNPAHDNLNIDLNDGFVGTILISNTSGENIYKKLVDNSSLRIDVSDWVSGIYFLMIKDEQNYSKVHKIVITK